MALRIICLILLTLAVTGCEESALSISNTNARPAIWCASDMAQITGTTKQFNDYNTVGDDKIVKLFSALNETVAFQIIVDVPAGVAIDKLNLTHTSLITQNKRKISANNITIFRMMPQQVSQYPAWYLRLTTAPAVATDFYDILVPLDAPNNAQPYHTSGAQRLCFWVDIKVLPTDLPGTYRGIIDIRDGKKSIKKQIVELKVFEFILPLDKPIATVGGFSHRELFSKLLKRPNGQPFNPTWLDTTRPEVIQALRVMDDLFQQAHRHRLDLFDTALEPKIKRDKKGFLQLDWTTFDKIAGPYLSGKAFADEIPVSAWPIPFSTTWPNPEYYGGSDSVNYALMAREYFLQAARHFRSIGSQERFFAWPYRGDVSQGAYSTYQQIAEIAKNVDDTIPLMCPLPISPPKQTTLTAPKNLAESIGISALQGQWFDPSVMIQPRPTNPLIGTWFQPGQPPYLPGLELVSSPADIRALPWAVMKYNCTGLIISDVLGWGDKSSPTQLFYPGDKWGLSKALPSARLKRLRRGMTDLGYLWILQQRQKNKIARTIINSMIRYAGIGQVRADYFHPQLNGWVSRGDVWDTTRRLLAEEILDAVAVKRMTYREKVAQQVRWKHFVDATQMLRPQQIHSRITYDPTAVNQATGKIIQARINVNFYNEYQNALACEITALNMPFGFDPIAAKARADNIPPATSLEMSLAIAAGEIPKTPNGKVPLDIRVATSNKRSFTLLGEIPIIQAARISAAPTIDGKLSDWPSFNSNTAGDFILLGKLGKVGTGLAKRQTRVHVVQDAENLYFAFRCFEPNLPGMKVRPTNKIRYSNLLGWGEDFIELLIAPGNNAKATSDLYHIAIKPNGVVIQQKGVSCDPPLGAVSPIDLGVEAAVGTDKFGWIVEMKLPRKNFGINSKTPLWGINFTRYATQGQEASSWSGAENYFYDPQTLGAIFMDEISAEKK